MKSKTNKLSQLIYQLSMLDKSMYLKGIYHKGYEWRNYYINKIRNKNKYMDVNLLNSVIHHPEGNYYKSKIRGNSKYIIDALRWGFRTDLDVARYFNISKRTADRIMHPKEHYVNNNLHFNHVIKIYNFIDDINVHWIRRKSRHPSKKNKYDWKLTSNVLMGKYKPITVVDNVTFTHYESAIESPIEKSIKKHYGKKSRGYILQAMFHKQNKLLINKIKIKILSALINKFSKQKVFKNFNKYLAYYNRRYISLIYRAEVFYQDMKWDMPVKMTKKGQQYKFRNFYDIKRPVITQRSYSLDRAFYKFDSSIYYKISSALFYWYLYRHKKYNLIPKSKQIMLHSVCHQLVWDFNKPQYWDTNPRFKTNIESKRNNKKNIHSKRIFSIYYNNWHH